MLKSFKAVSDGWAQWWRDKFQELRARGHNSGKDHIRGLLKGPVMTFPYSATERGMADKIAEVYAEFFDGSSRRTGGPLPGEKGHGGL